MKSLSRYIAICLLCLPLLANAQRVKNNIYLFDCTSSMKGNQLWDKAQDALDATVNTQFRIPGSQFHVIPFGDVPLEVIGFDQGSYSRQGNEKTFAKVMQDSRNTHITPTMERGFELCNPNMENNVYLLTDGLPNNQDSPEKVAAAISKWCNNHRNTRFFYVALKDNVVNPTIRRAIDACPDAFIVEIPAGSNVIPQIVGLYSDLNPNIEELEGNYRISTGIPGGFPIQISSADPFFDVKQVGEIDERGDMKVKFVARNGMDASQLHQALAERSEGGIYRLRFRVTSKDDKYLIANPEVMAAMADHIQSALTILEGEEETDMGKCAWHDSFLWSSASEPGSVSVDLQPIFKNVVSNGAFVSFIVMPADGQNHDFTVYYNGVKLPENEPFNVAPGQPAELTIVFDTDAETGTRHFVLLPRARRGVDLLNGKPFESNFAPDAAPTLRAKYSEKWNPLKTCLFWLGIVVAGLLVLWFLMLKKMMYPTIKATRYILLGPDSYRSDKRIKGKRRVVISSKKCKQNFLSKLFTGEILYVTAEPYTAGLQIEAATKKKVRIKNLSTGADGWDMESGVLAPYESSKLVNRANPALKASIEIQ